MDDKYDRIAGCLFGAAFGDALAAPTEFMSVERITQVYGPEGPSDLSAPVARVTDDTQMMLAVGEALIESKRPITAETLAYPLNKAFTKWFISPENDRAPGMTCLRACEVLAKGGAWLTASARDSKGCGANMRVQPVGTLQNVDENNRAAIAQFQAAHTHGHATGLAAADLTATTIAYLVRGETPDHLPVYLRDYAKSQRTTYHYDWLKSLWERPFASSPEAFIERGWDECLSALDNLDAALKNHDRESDPCLATGEGWVAEEAFATGLFCFLMYPDDPVKTIKRAAVTSGDSDSIACLAGAFAGAYSGLAVWPSSWLERIEYKSRLAIISQEISG